MVPPFLIFGPSHVKKDQDPNRNINLELIFCKHYCAQMTNSIPGTIGKCSLERKFPFVTKFVLIMDSCFIQYIAPLVKVDFLAQKINSFCQEQLLICQFQFKFIIFEIQIVADWYTTILSFACITLEVYTYFSSIIVNCPFCFD